MKKHATQRGTTLVVVLIFLALMTLFGISAFNSSTSNMRIVGNTQARQESLSAAQLAVEQTISSSMFYTNPNGVAASPVLVDMDGDGTTDYTAIRPAPQCTRAKPILASDLPEVSKSPAAVDAYAPCRPSSNQGGTFVERETPTSGIDPLGCANSEWQVSAEVTDAKTQTKVAVNQGVAVVVFGNEVSSYCQ